MYTLATLGLEIKPKGLREAARLLDQVADASENAERKKAGFEARAKSATTTLGGLQQRFQNILGPATAFAGLLGVMGFGALVSGAMQAVGVLTNLGRSAIGVADMFESMKIRLGSLRGSVAEAQKDFAWILKFAIDTPLELKDVTQGFSQMLAYGIEPTTGAMRNIVDVASSVGGGMETLDAVIRGVGQAWAKGNLKAEEARQLLERGIPVWGKMAEILGVTEEQVMEMATANELGRASIDALLKGLGADRFGAAERQMLTLGGKFSNLADIATNALGSIGEEMSGPMKDAVDELILLLGDLGDRGVYEMIGSGFATAISAFTELVRAARELADPLSKIVAVLSTFMSLAMDALAERISGVANALSRLSETKGSVMGLLGLYLEGNASYTSSGSDITSHSREVLLERQMREEKIRMEAEAQAAAAAAREEIEQRRLKMQEEKEAELAAKAEQRAKELAKKQEEAAKEKFKADLERLEERTQKALNDAVIESLWNKDKYNEYIGHAETQTGKFYTNTVYGYIEQTGEKMKAAFEKGVEPSRWEILLGNLGRQIQTSLADTIYLVFTGDFDRLGEAFDGLFKSITGNAADMLSKGMMEAFGKAMKGESGAVGRYFGSQEFKSGMGMMIGGMIQNYGQQQAAQGNQGVGILAGMAGGAIQGAMVGGWVGAVVGAVVGGLSAYFGSADSPDPHMRVNYSSERGFGVYGSGDLGMSQEDYDSWSRKMNAVVRKEVQAYRSIMQSIAIATFGEEGLGSTLMDIMIKLEDIDFGRLQGTGEEVGRYISEVWLPEQLNSIFGPNMERGLSALGLSVEGFAGMMTQLAQLPVEDRLSSLQTIVNALIGAAQLIDSMSGEAILGDVRMDPYTRLRNLMDDTSQRIDVFSTGWQDMVDAAGEMTQINQLVLNVRQAEIQYLQQLDQMQKALNASIDAQIEELRLGGMSDQQKAEYFGQDIVSLYQQLQAGGLTSTQTMEIIQQLQSRISQFTQLVGEDQLDTRMADVFGNLWGFGSSSDIMQPILDSLGLNAGTSGRDFFIAMLEQIRTMGNEVIDDERQAIIDKNQEYIDSLQGAIDAMNLLGQTINDIAGYNPIGTGPRSGGLEDDDLNLYGGTGGTQGDMNSKGLNTYEGEDRDAEQEALREMYRQAQRDAMIEALRQTGVGGDGGSLHEDLVAIKAAIAEDTATIAALLVEILKASNITVEVTNNGSIAALMPYVEAIVNRGQAARSGLR